MKEEISLSQKYKICVSGARETSSCGFDSLEIAEKLGTRPRGLVGMNLGVTPSRD
jgi:hypothetical protein